MSRVYEEVHRRSLEDPKSFWGAAAEDLHWDRRWDRVLDDRHPATGVEVAAGEIGELAVKLPLPPGTLATLWNANERFVDAYLSDYPSYYRTSDAGFIDSDGYVSVMARTDDINVAGWRYVSFCFTPRILTVQALTGERSPRNPTMH